MHITNDDLLAALTASHAAGKMTPTLAKLLQELAQRLSFHRHFIRYTTREDMVSFGVMTLLTAWKSFDPSKGINPHGYFSKCLFRAFYLYQNIDYRERIAKDVLRCSQEHPDIDGEFDQTFSHDPVGENTDLRKQLEGRLKEAGRLELANDKLQGRHGLTISYPESFIFNLDVQHLQLDDDALTAIVELHLQSLAIKPKTIRFHLNGKHLTTVPYHTSATPVKQPKVRHSQLSCPHCGKTGEHGAITRWHLDNCKNRTPNPAK